MNREKMIEKLLEQDVVNMEEMDNDDLLGQEYMDGKRKARREFNLCEYEEKLEEMDDDELFGDADIEDWREDEIEWKLELQKQEYEEYSNEDLENLYNAVFQGVENPWENLEEAQENQSN